MLLPLLDRLFGKKISTMAMAFGVVAYQQGDRRGGGRLLSVASAAAPADAALQSYGAGEAAKAGDYAIALRLWDRALQVEPGRSEYALQAAIAQRALGDVEGAVARCERALAHQATTDPGYALMELLAVLRMPGPSYLENLAMIQEWLAPRTYVEIGVASGRSIALVRHGTRAVGIDPAPDLMVALPSTTTIYAKTSDAFFAEHDLRGELGGVPVDLAFIDGMHLFEFALRDFMNVERHCTPGSTILLDDCWPLDARTAARERTTAFWNGDVWRILPALRKYRPELSIRVVATVPAGLCVVRGLDPGSRVLAERYDDIVREFGALDYSDFEKHQETYLRPCPNDAGHVRELFG